MLYNPTDAFSAELTADYAHDANTPIFSQLISYNPYGKRVRTLAEVTAGPSSAPAGTINPLAPLVKVHTDRQSVSDIGTIQQPSIDETGGASLIMKYKVSRTWSFARSPRAAPSHQPVGQLGHRIPQRLRAQRQLRPLQPVGPLSAPVQPGIPGRRQLR
uniref:TonB-dependent receptor-like beta-barrel domain-containing protein n=1 Tax=Phenylobacterium glaciei TaxID=2803784 RepID=A0A974P4H7_9CAUL|nr:hypothetical protein JKL49_05740 [Phenylobacterium glaciei]